MWTELAQTIRPNVQVPRELWAEVKREATQQGTTAGKIVERILRGHYKKDDAK